MTSMAVDIPSTTDVPTNKGSYGDYHREYYQKNKAKIWEKVKETEAYKEKYKRYYQKHKERLNKQRTERNRAKRALEKPDTETAVSSTTA